MNVTRRYFTAVLPALLMLTLSGTALATNGYFTHGVGTQSKGMAGTGVGSDNMRGSIIAASNPALTVFADDNWEVGLSIFSPRRSYKAGTSFVNGQFGAFTIGAGKFHSSSEYFPIPYLAKNFRLGDGNVLNLTFYGRGGMNTDWDNSNASATSMACDPTGQAVVTGPGPYCSGDAGVDLSQAFIALNYAGKSSDSFAWGIGPVFAVQVFEAKGVASFTPFTKTFAESYVLTGMPAPADSLTDNGHDTSVGYGFVGGIWWAMGSSVSAGLSYQSKISMSEFDEYADLFAESGGFDIPSSTKLGISFGRGSDVRVNFDVEHTRYSQVASVGNSMANILNCPTAGMGGTDLESCLGGKNGAGFGWDDMTTYKLGFEWMANEATIWRAGYSYGKQPIQEVDVTFNILAPGVMEQHVTIGLTKNNWNFSLMYAPSKTIEGQNLMDPTQIIELEMRQLEFELSYAF